MKFAREEIVVATRGRGAHEITERLARFVAGAGVGAGLLHVFCPHTSCALMLQENYDPDVLADMEDALARLAPEGAGWRHASEGPDDMPAHIRAALLGAFLLLPIAQGSLALGTWQGAFLYEHRTHGRRRRLVLTAWGGAGT